MFKWWVDVEGYQWERDDESVVPAASLLSDGNGNWPDCHLAPIRYVFRPYEPFKIPELFRIFADTPPDPAGILAFSNVYGHLGDDVAQLDYPIDPPEFESKAEEEEWWEETRRLVRLFDPIHRWTRAIRAMRECVRSWDDIQQGQAEEGAIGKLLVTVNQQLTGDRCRLVFAEERQTPTGYAMRTVPSNLLAALWIQLGQTVTENRQHRRCAVCRKWFAIAPPYKRKSRHYCNDACRSQAYRNRKEQALGMKAMGKSVEEIADALDSNAATVEGWLWPGSPASKSGGAGWWPTAATAASASSRCRRGGGTKSP